MFVGALLALLKTSASIRSPNTIPCSAHTMGRRIFSKCSKNRSTLEINVRGTYTTSPLFKKTFWDKSPVAKVFFKSSIFSSGFSGPPLINTILCIFSVQGISTRFSDCFNYGRWCVNLIYSRGIYLSQDEDLLALK